MIEETLFRFNALSMLSCPRSQPYWTLMGIPIEEAEYPKLTRASHYALGVLIATNERMFGPNAIKLWDEFHSKTRTHQITGSGYISEICQKRVDFNQVLSDLIRDQDVAEPNRIVAWISKEFRISSDPVIRIEDYIKQRFESMKGTNSEFGDRFLKFTTRFGFSKNWIETHFMIASNVLIMQRRSRWESFLGSVVGYKRRESEPLWFEPIRYCIEYRRFQFRWNELRDVVGKDSLSRLIDEMQTDCASGKYSRFKFDASDFDRLRWLVANSEVRADD